MNLLHLLDAGNGYIVSKSLLKSTKAEQKWACDEEGYTVVSKDFKYKSRIVKRTVKDENGNSRTFEEKVVVYWSEKFEARSIRENKKFLDFLKKMEAQEVIDKYHGLTQIEDQFRVMKGDLDTRPLYVRTPEHIDAHLLTCMIALVIMRIIQKRLRDTSPEETKDVYWNVGMSGERIQTALNKWKVDTLPGDYFRFMDIDDPNLGMTLKAFNVSIPAKLYRRAELKSIKTSIHVFK